MQLQPAQIVAIAAACHELNRAYCIALGDNSQPEWKDAPPWQANSAIEGVEFHLNNPNAGPEASHENWLKGKLAEGWRYGEVKDAEKKTHPCILPFEQLPPEQRAKDHLFRATVHIMAAQQHRKIAGYRELTPYEIALMNRIKAHGTETAALLDEVNRHVIAQHEATQPAYAEPQDAGEMVFGTECTDTVEETADKVAEALRLKQAQPWRWHAIANTKLQEGLMALTRAVAQPTNF